MVMLLIAAVLVFVFTTVLTIAGVGSAFINRICAKEHPCEAKRIIVHRGVEYCAVSV